MNVLDRFKRLPGIGGAETPDVDARLDPVQRVAGGSSWDDRVGASRAVRVGDLVVVAGCIAVADDSGDLPPDVQAQTARALESALAALGRTGLRRSDVVRTRLHVVDLPRHADAVARAHSSVFDAVRPVVSVVGVAALAHPDALVEVELEAVRRPSSPPR